MSDDVATGDDVALHDDVALLTELLWLQTADVVDDVDLEG